MDRKIISLSLGACLVLSAIGCGSSEDVAPASISGNQDTATSNNDTVTSESEQHPEIAVTVKTFLEMFRKGDQDGVTKMLTKRAVAALKAANQPLNPPGSETASYEVGEVNKISSTLAHVASRLTDVDDGQEYSEDSTWIVKLEGTTWRIAGMMVQPDPSKEPVTFDFENPDFLQPEPVQERVAEQLPSAQPLVNETLPAGTNPPARHAMRNENPFSSPSKPQ